MKCSGRTQRSRQEVKGRRRSITNTINTGPQKASLVTDRCIRRTSWAGRSGTPRQRPSFLSPLILVWKMATAQEDQREVRVGEVVCNNSVTDSGEKRLKGLCDFDAKIGKKMEGVRLLEKDL